MKNLSSEIMYLPAVPLRGTSILPGMIVHFDVSRARSRASLERAMRDDQRVFLVTQHDPNVEDPDISDVWDVGVVAFVKQVNRLPRNMIRVLVEGMERAVVNAFEKTEDFILAGVQLPENADTQSYPASLTDAMLRNMKDLFAAYYTQDHNISRDVIQKIMETDDLETLLTQIAINLPLSYEKRQLILEALTVEEQYETLGVILTNEAEVMAIRKDLQEKIRERVDKNQKEYILREQLKVIREELGEDTTLSDIDNFKAAVKKLKAKKEVKDKLYEEINRFQNLPGQSPESAVLRGYIETLLALPWDKASRDRHDLIRAKQILDRDHYGLVKVKDRVLEFLAVRQLTGSGAGPILCLVGPPGTGKTSIGHSIAEALNKKYIRLSLGGVRDEAEIRGHRRTYVGAMPGRIVNGMKKAGVRNPLMMLDEIDKLSSDYKGDTASALLEVLDSEQNSHFEDHYIEIPVDLSDVLFIATANNLLTIPRPLLDRMEVIEISSYTENEKMHIAKDHLIPKQIEKNGLKKRQLAITDDAIADIIAKYTREAGVRALEREIAEICRKSARRILEEGVKKITVTPENLEEFLGYERYSINKANDEDEVGIVRGLAWTAVGGVTLQVEVNIMPGKGDVRLTGQLGDVMKESAQAGISYIRSVAGNYQVAEDFFQTHDIHIHIPEGAVPKDGPSAGVTMATAILSAVTDRKVRADVAMTGEITLRGRVLPIGGLKEKLLAAKKAGIRTVLIPEKNRNDMKEVEGEITDGLEIIYASTMEDVLRTALVPGPEDGGK